MMDQMAACARPVWLLPKAALNLARRWQMETKEGDRKRRWPGPTHAVPRLIVGSSLG
jgi:hypothetical protein